jgi:hypothetical protein
MSYARWGEDGSSVYVIGTNDGERDLLVCVQCSEGSSFSCESALQMLSHLIAHRERGDVVPERAFERLREEIGET